MKTITIERADVEKALYAAVGAPVAAGRKLQAEAGKLQEIDLKAKADELKAKLDELKGKAQDLDLKAKADEVGTKAEALGAKAREDLLAAYAAWSRIGAEVVGDLRTKVDVDDLTTKVGEKVHVDQWQEQAGKLRSQLEDLVGNWRANFAPEGEVTETVAVEVDTPAELTAVNGVGPTYAARLTAAGIGDLAALAKADAARVAEVAKVAEKVAAGWIAEATTLA